MRNTTKYRKPANGSSLVVRLEDGCWYESLLLHIKGSGQGELDTVLGYKTVLLMKDGYTKTWMFKDEADGQVIQYRSLNVAMPQVDDKIWVLFSLYGMAKHFAPYACVVHEVVGDGAFKVCVFDSDGVKEEVVNLCADQKRTEKHILKMKAEDCTEHDWSFRTKLAPAEKPAKVVGEKRMRSQVEGKVSGESSADVDVEVETNAKPNQRKRSRQSRQGNEITSGTPTHVPEAAPQTVAHTHQESVPAMARQVVIDEGAIVKRLELILRGKFLDLETKQTQLEAKFASWFKELQHRIGEGSSSNGQDKGFDPYLVDLPGVFMERHKVLFDNQDTSIKRKFYPGYTGICINKRLMCANYKNTQINNGRGCISREIGDERFEDKGAKKYFTAPATYIALSVLGAPSIRCLGEDAAWLRLKHMALCSSCRVSFRNDDYMDMVKRWEICVCCKTCRHSDVTARQSPLPFCGECWATFNDSTNSNREDFAELFFGVLAKIFPKHNIRIKTDKGIRVKSLKDGSSGMRFPDVRICMSYEGIESDTSLELDPNMHPGMSQESEARKMIEQATAMVQGASTNTNHKLFCIRMNPNSAYDMDGSTKIDEYSVIERYIIMRQWLIWYIVNIKKVRKGIMMYMWYDKSKEKNLFAKDFEGFTMQYHAPMPPHESPWMYGVDPTEATATNGEKRYYNNVISKRVEVPERLTNPIVDGYMMMI